MFLGNYFHISIMFFFVLFNAAQILGTNKSNVIIASKVLHQKTNITQIEAGIRPDEINVLCESGTFRSLNIANENVLVTIKSKHKKRAFFLTSIMMPPEF